MYLKKSAVCPKCKHGKGTWTPLESVASVPLVVSLFSSDLNAINRLLEKAKSSVLLMEDYEDDKNPKLIAYKRWTEVECGKCGTRFLLDCGEKAMVERGSLSDESSWKIGWRKPKSKSIVEK